MRSFVRPAVVAIGALVLALSSSVPVSAMWTQSTVEGSWLLTRPSLQVDGTDHTGVAYERLGQDPGIFYATNATGSWVSSRITSADDSLPALRFDAAAHAHVAFARRSGTTGIYVTDDSTGSWAAPALAAADLDPTFPSLAIDGSGHMAIAYTSTYSFTPGLYVVTNATGTWVRTRLTAATWDGTTSIQFDATGHAHVMFVRYAPEDPGVYYATNASGSWVIARLTSSFDDNASFVFDGAGRIHATFRRLSPGPEATFYATNATGNWVISQLPRLDTDTFGPPAIALDASGAPHIAVSVSTEAPGDFGTRLEHWFLSGTSWNGSSDAPNDGGWNDEFPALGFLGDGTLQLAFRRLDPSAGVRILESGSSSSLVAGSSVGGGASIALGPSGARDLAWSRRMGSDEQTAFATGTGGGWTLDTPGSGSLARFATDIAVDPSGAVRIVDGGSYYSNASAAWTSDLSLTRIAESHVAVDGSGHAQAVYSALGGAGWEIGYQTNASGTWVSDPPFAPGFGFGDDPEPSMAVDAAGSANIAWVDPEAGGNAAIDYRSRVSGSWSAPETVASGTNAWPSIGVDGAGKVHIAYIHYGSAPGIYYATNRSGAWVTTRITRSYAEGAPSLAIDGAGHVYVATTRASWAADPGVYVMTNASGAWVVARVVATESAGNVSLAVTSGGLARMVFVTDQGLLEYEDSVATVSVQTNGALTNVLRSQLAASVGETPRTDGIGSSTGTGPTTGPATAPHVRSRTGAPEP